WPAAAQHVEWPPAGKQEPQRLHPAPGSADAPQGGIEDRRKTNECDFQTNAETAGRRADASSDDSARRARADVRRRGADDRPVSRIRTDACTRNPDPLTLWPRRIARERQRLSPSGARLQRGGAK